MSTGGPTVTTYTPPAGLRAIISGVGGVREHLAETLRAQGVRRPMILCGRNVGATPLVQVVAAAAGMDCAIFTGSQEHTPISAVDSGRDAARDCGADALIALGGSSAIDCAKAVAVLLRRNLASASELEPVGFTRAAEGLGTNPDPMPLICIPTTLSAAEFYPFFGMRDTGQRRKQPYVEEGLVSRTLFFDGEIAASTPGKLWAETGVKSMDDALYRYCSEPSDEPASDAVLVCGIRGLFEGLAAGIDGDPAARQDNFFHLWLASHPMPRVRPPRRMIWFSIAARHALGGVTGLAHGIGSCVSLTEALRFHAPGTDARQARLAQLLGQETGPEIEGPLAPAFARWLATLGVPTRLGGLGMDRAAVSTVVDHMIAEAPNLGSAEAVRAAFDRLW